MPADVKSLENQTKHLTKEEIQAREEAEAAVLPFRAAKLKIPRSLNKDAGAKRYWKSILERMEGLAILDDLDSEMLAVYCAALSRKDSLQALCRELMESVDKEPDPKVRLELVEELDGLLTKVQNHEKTLLSFANNLGMTPEARVRLARKRAAQPAQPEAADDLFGD